MDRLLFAVQWLHVLLGILWFGYALSMYFLVSPALAAYLHDPHALRPLRSADAVRSAV